MTSAFAVDPSMRGLALGLALVTLAAGAPAARASSAPPDFSGNWTLVSTGISFDSPLGAQGLVTQTATNISFAPSGTPGRAVTYRLDSPETTYTTTSVRGTTSTHVAQVRWVTSALLVTTKTNAGTVGQWEDLTVFSLDGSGNLNIVKVDTLKAMEPVMGTRVLSYRRQ